MEILREDDPFLIFQNWIEAAKAAQGGDYNAMCLATATPDGRPSARMVLLKDWGPEGFVFYTNMESRKGRELRENPRAALCFHWEKQGRQVRVEGHAQPVPAPLADAYFRTRHILSRLGAWASRQSAPLRDRAELEGRLAQYRDKFGDDVPRPPHWGGWRVIPQTIEFWQDGRGRLHDRFLFTRAGAGWDAARLNP